MQSASDMAKVMTATIPQLLVSVRNVAEARAALDGGCDVLDIKDPAQGALGMAAVATITEIATQFQRSPVPISVALGDVPEWNTNRPPPQLPLAIEFLKLGTAGLENDTAWQSAFAAVQRRINDSIQSHKSGLEPIGTLPSPLAGEGPGVRGSEFSDTLLTETRPDFAGSSAPSWIAVAYADWQIARGPEPEQVIAAASECNCHGVLIDTFSKGRLRLLDWLDSSRLSSVARQAHELGLTFALAGRLEIGDLPQVLSARPDIVGIRSAACRDGNRSNEICAGAVRAFRDALLGRIEELPHQHREPPVSTHFVERE